VTRFLLVCLGGAAGTGARYLLGLWAARAWPSGIPWGTLLVNTLGSFLLVLVMGAGARGALLSADARAVLATGVLGGFTTYSTFNHETLRLMMQGSPGLAALYLLATVSGCLAAGVFALWLLRIAA
jgi:CrcB protein